MNPRKTWEQRAALKNACRLFFEARQYLEIDTPIVVPCPGTEIHLEYFSTTWKDLRGEQKRLFLRSSPELHMKQALCEGLGRVYQFAPSFRNTELTEWHHPEFIMLEWYESGISFDDFVSLTEEFLRYTAKGPLWRESPVHEVLRKKLPRLSVTEAFSRFAKIDLKDCDADLAVKACRAGVVSVNENDDFETAYFKVLIEKVEPALERLGAVVLCDYPPSQAALAVCDDGVAKRFEIYIGRVELCNGFLELLDGEENEKRFREGQKLRRDLGKEVVSEDVDFWKSLNSGLPQCCGVALGFDRWLALLLGEGDLNRVVPFRGNSIYRER